MRVIAIAACISVAAAAASQTITQVYNRDTHDPFKLKDVKVESTVFGPVVRTSTLLTFENPYKNLTEASVWFDMPEAAALGGFAYYFGDEYVRGTLMDKAKAWFIYTAITSRNRDPGIMDQVTPTSYHAQIYPLKVGSDLRVRLYSVQFLQPKEDQLTLTSPAVFDKQADDNWKVRIPSEKLVADGKDLTLPPPHPVSAVAQRFKDGRTYIAGIMRAEPRETLDQYPLKIVKAEYGNLSNPAQVADVTERLRQVAGLRSVRVRVTNQQFGIDPAPGIVKDLRVTYDQGSTRQSTTVRESDELALGIRAPDAQNPTFAGLRQAKWLALDDKTIAFMGWLPRNRKIAVRHNGVRAAFKPELAHKGSEAARLWAQQRLAQDHWNSRAQVLRFSLKYGVPSAYTALLAVPKQEMKLFKAKEKEFQKQQQQEARRQRQWQNAQEQNWNRSRGGDPEIRVIFTDAQKVEAILPDGRIIPLRQSQEVWGGNFDIPAAAPEGQYRIRVVATKADGSTEEKSLSYSVDRTPPDGRYEVKQRNGMLVLEVRSEAKLAEVALFLRDGSRLILKEVEPGVYRLELPMNRLEGTIVLKDAASNKRELPCSWQP